MTTLTLDQMIDKALALPAKSPSNFKVEVVEVSTITKHPNADRLDCLTFNNYDWVVIAAKNEDGTSRYKPGDKVIYVPIDSVLAPKLEGFLFPPDSKIKLSKSRVKSIRIRKCVSQGMTVDLGSDLLSNYPDLKHVKLGDDVQHILGITKYEPPISELPSRLHARAKIHTNPFFKQYTDIDNFKKYPDAFEGKEVYVSEKIHGTSARYANLNYALRNFREFSAFVHHAVPNFHYKMLTSKTMLTNFKMIGKELVLTLRDKFTPWLSPKFELCFGSRRVQLQEKGKSHKTFYDENVYAMIFEQLGLKNLLQPGEALYGEIVGLGIQSGYNYGCKEGEYRFFAYDVQIDEKFLSYADFDFWCKSRNIPTVPKLYQGSWNRETIDKLRSGDSTVGGQKIREGVVVKPTQETIDTRLGRLVLKWINDDYLCQNMELTDFH